MTNTDGTTVTCWNDRHQFKAEDNQDLARHHPGWCVCPKCGVMVNISSGAERTDLERVAAVKRIREGGSDGTPADD